MHNKTTNKISAWSPGIAWEAELPVSDGLAMEQPRDSAILRLSQRILEGGQADRIFSSGICQDGHCQGALRLADSPTPKTVANWQCHFFSRRKSLLPLIARAKRMFANRGKHVGKVANSLPVRQNFPEREVTIGLLPALADDCYASKRNNRSPASTCVPGLTSTSATVPAFSA
jgi:hypothetical protein